jgi:hypothetical protein
MTDALYGCITCHHPVGVCRNEDGDTIVPCMLCKCLEHRLPTLRDAFDLGRRSVETASLAKNPEPWPPWVELVRRVDYLERAIYGKPLPEDVAEAKKDLE